MIISVAIMVAALVGVGVVAVSVLRDSGRDSDATARNIPADADAYLYLDIEAARGDEIQQLLAPFPGNIREMVPNGLFNALQEELGFAAVDDAASWVGRYAVLALFDVDEESRGWTLIVRVDDRDAAAAFIDRVIEAAPDDRAGEMTREEYNGADVISLGEEGALALTGRHLVSGRNRERVTAAIDNLESPPLNPLAEDEAFVAASAALPSDHAAFFFLTVSAFDWSILEAMGPLVSGGLGVLRLVQGVPDFMAGAVSLIESGVRLDVYVDRPEEAPVPAAENRLRSVDRLPGDALALYSSVGLDAAWGQLSASPEVASLFEEDAILGGVAGIGLSALDSPMRTLTGEVALALLPSDLSVDGEGDLESAIHALLLAETEDAGGFAALLESVRDLLGIRSDEVDIGEHQATIWDLNVLGGPATPYRPGYMAAENMFVVGSTEDSLRQFNAALTGAADSLGANASLTTALALAPQPLHFLLYADLAGLAGMMESGILGEAFAGFQPYAAPFEALAITGSSTEEASRFTVTVTLKH